MTIGSPVGTVTTYTFTPDGTLQAFVIPFHDGPIRVTCVGGNVTASGIGDGLNVCSNRLIDRCGRARHAEDRVVIAIPGVLTFAGELGRILDINVGAGDGPHPPTKPPPRPGC